MLCPVPLMPENRKANQKNGYFSSPDSLIFHPHKLYYDWGIENNIPHNPVRYTGKARYLHPDPIRILFRKVPSKCR